ncbi:MAG: single-stranded DNA-binding protein [Firmicutes bacterium]|nr:single-stranded DNA-binding protein [Bacillota bacterium]
MRETLTNMEEIARNEFDDIDIKGAESPQSNKVYLSGKVASDLTYSHELYGEGFYEFVLEVPRLSNHSDKIPITVSERLITGMNLELGTKVSLNGQFRSYNKMVGERSKLMLTVFVRDFDSCEEADNPNSVEISGYICKMPIYRTTPFNREICDILVAVNRAYNKSDYIPCIAWGRNARFVKDIGVGQKITVYGRVQSREYTKKLSDTMSETRIAYELSINKIAVEE